MIKGILIYPVLFITTLYWFFVFNDDVVAFMLAFEILYFVTTAVYMLISKKKFNLHMECLHQTAEKNQKVPIRIIAENESKVFPMYFRLYFKIENTLTGEKTKYKTFRIAGRDSRKVITIHVSASDCGYMDVSLKKVRIYDLFTLFSVPKKVKERISVRILPELHLLPIEITRKTRDFISDADEYSTRESGDDPAEIYQIREYKEKDSIHDIHWKLSAKSDELMVKERGKALGSSVLIWVNTAAKNISPDILEIIASVSLSLFELECIHTVAWFEQDKGIVRKKE